MSGKTFITLLVDPLKYYLKYYKLFGLLSEGWPVGCIGGLRNNHINSTSYTAEYQEVGCTSDHQKGEGWSVGGGGLRSRYLFLKFSFFNFVQAR